MPKRLLIAIAGSLPVAVVAAVSLGLTINLGDALSTIFFWIVWGASTFYAVREIEPRRVFGRTAITYAVAAFTLPLSAAIFAASSFGEVESSMNEAEGALEGIIGLLIGAALLEFFLIMAVVVGVFGVITGLVAILLARFLLRGQDSEIPESTEGDTPTAGGLGSVLSALRRVAAGGVRRARLGNRGTVLGLGLVALILLVIAGIAIYGLLVSEDTQEPTLTIAPTPVPIPPTPSLAAGLAPTSAPVPPTPSLAAGPTATTQLQSRSTSPPTAISVATPAATPDLCLRYVTHDLREAMWESIEALRCVIEAGADVNARDDRGNPMLYWAILEDENAVELARTLVEAGADVNARDDRGNPMLYWAILEDDYAVELVWILVKAGADVNAKDNRGNPMLYWAMLEDKAVELARTLVEAGADVNARDDNDRSMLYWATIKDNLEVVQILVDAGATE